MAHGRNKPRKLSDEEKKNLIMANASIDVGFVDSRIVLRSITSNIRRKDKIVPETGTVREELDNIKEVMKRAYFLLDSGENLPIKRFDRKKEQYDELIILIDIIKKRLRSIN